ncbi:MAG: DUF3300 domain-containing protein [Rhodospirillaceae bacterium]|nr:DUF3300 domain-containing protein [Rhodospirillaceae bacterium]
MNFKAMAAVVGLGLGGTVLALAAARDSADETPVVAENPAPKPAAPVAENVAEKVEESAPVKSAPAKTVPQDATPAVVRAAAKAPPAVEKAPPKPTATQQQLDALLAPVALFPDQLLSQILMASTYPLDVVEAARWRALPENQNLSGEPLAAALENEDWDPSVKALVPFPEILKMMDSDLGWMERVGDAFADQQADVMDSVQRLRREARAADKLKSDNRRQVLMQDDQILIEPATPDVVYVPFYNPADAYGVWPYPDYPPAYIPPPLGYTYAPYVVYNYVTINPYWGWSTWDWRHRHIRIYDPPRWKHYQHGHDNIWRHNPDRGGRGRGDRWRGQRPQPGVTPNPEQPIVIKDGDFPRRGNGDRNRDGDRGGRRDIDAPPAQPMPRARDVQRQPGTLPEMPPLPATAQLPAIAPPISNPDIGVQAPRGQHEQADTMRARRNFRDQQFQQQQQQQRENDALRMRQFQDRSIGAPALSNLPPPQQQRLRDTSIGAPPVTNIQPPVAAQQQFPNRGQFGGGGRQMPVAMPAPAPPPAIAPAIAPAAQQTGAPQAEPPARMGRGSFDPGSPMPNARTRENSR